MQQTSYAATSPRQPLSRAPVILSALPTRAHPHSPSPPPDSSLRRNLPMVYCETPGEQIGDASCAYQGVLWSCQDLCENVSRAPSSFPLPHTKTTKGQTICRYILIQSPPCSLSKPALWSIFGMGRMASSL